MIFVANFKMALTTHQTLAYLNQNLEGFTSLAHQSRIILCPSFTALAIAREILPAHVSLGAQNCCHQESGAYTGEVSSTDLMELGITHCIVGHSERRSMFSESNGLIAQKAKILLDHKITPIFCIGESRNDHEASNTLVALKQQLTPLFEALKNNPPQKIFIAYEPVWAIGTGLVPTTQKLSATLTEIQALITEHIPQFTFSLLYGGSASSQTIATLAPVKPLDGFLVGGASLDFQEFKKLVDYF